LGLENVNLTFPIPHLPKEINTNMSGYTQPDPHTTTRRAFTANLLNAPVQAPANSEYAKLQNALKTVLTLLINHKAMERNIDQTFMTPAASKNKVYFMWDFVGRTLGMLYMLDPAAPKGDAWEDVAGRCGYARHLMENDGLVSGATSS
jgi:hypothetical protein